MTIPYRTRSFLKSTALTVLVLLLVLVAAWLCWLLWLGRYVVYTRDGGAVLDFSQSNRSLSGTVAVAPVISDPITVYYNEGENAVNTSTELARLSGYYVTAQELETDMEAIRNTVRMLPKGTPVMIDVKSGYGNFFYSSAVSENRNPDIDTQAMDELISQITQSGCYAIARFPALRDRLYGLEHVNDGLPVAAGYLWMDDGGCYWLNPISDGTVSYLTRIISELKNLGFQEVVLADYYFPSTDSIVFRSDKAEALAKTAQTLVSTCSSDSFAVSFVSESSFTAPSGRSRIYLKDIAAADAAAKADGYGFEEPDARVVFLTDVHDTRFDSYSVLRPIDDAEIQQ